MPHAWRGAAGSVRPHTSQGVHTGWGQFPSRWDSGVQPQGDCGCSVSSPTGSGSPNYIKATKTRTGRISPSPASGDAGIWRAGAGKGAPRAQRPSRLTAHPAGPFQPAWVYFSFQANMRRSRMNMASSPGASPENTRKYQGGGEMGSWQPPAVFGDLCPPTHPLQCPLGKPGMLLTQTGSWGEAAIWG